MSVFEGTVRAPEGLLADEANIYKRRDIDEPWTFLERIDIAQTFTVDITEAGPVEFAAAFIINGAEQPEDLWSLNTIESTSTTTLTDVGTPEDFVVTQDGPDLLCRWGGDAHPYLDHFELSMGSAVGKRVILHVFPGTATHGRTAWWGTGSTTFHLVAVSTQGQRSPEATVTVTIADEELMIEQHASDEHAGGFVDTKAGVEVSGGDLILETIPVGNAMSDAGNAMDYPLWGTHKDTGTYTTDWFDVGSVVTEKVEVEASFDVDTDTPVGTDALPPLEPSWRAGVAMSPGEPSLWRHVDGTFALVTALGVLIEIDTAQDATPTPEGWRRWVPGARYTYRQVRLRVTLSCEWCFSSPKLTGFAWRLLRRNLKDEGSMDIASTGGTSITFAQPFSQAPNITGMVVGANGWVAQANNITATGCDLRAYNAAGTEQGTATVHWHALGV